MDVKTILKKHPHILCGNSVSTIWTSDGIENEHEVYRGEDSNKKFNESFRELAVKITNTENKKMIPLTNEEYESYFNQI